MEIQRRNNPSPTKQTKMFKKTKNKQGGVKSNTLSRKKDGKGKGISTGKVVPSGKVKRRSVEIPRSLSFLQISKSTATKKQPNDGKGKPEKKEKHANPRRSSSFFLNVFKTGKRASFESFFGEDFDILPVEDYTIPLPPKADVCTKALLDDDDLDISSIESEEFDREAPLPPPPSRRGKMSNLNMLDFPRIGDEEELRASRSKRSTVSRFTRATSNFSTRSQSHRD